MAWISGSLRPTKPPGSEKGPQTEIGQLAKLTWKNPSLCSQHRDNDLKSCFGYVTRWISGTLMMQVLHQRQVPPCCNDRARCTFPYTARPFIVLASRTITSSHLYQDQFFMRILHNFPYQCLLLYKLWYLALIMLNQDSIRGEHGPA